MSWGKYKADPADKVFSLYIRTRDNWTCQYCHKRYNPPTNALHCSHFVGRAKEATRFDPLNAVALCFHDHQYFTSHPAEHLAWQVNRLGQETVDKLILAGNTYHKKDRQAELIYWKAELKKLNVLR